MEETLTAWAWHGGTVAPQDGSTGEDAGRRPGPDGDVDPEAREAAEARRRLAQGLRAFPEVTDPRVVEAIASVPRERFMPKRVRHQAFDDTAVPIGQGQTISAPHMVAIMCSVLGIRPGDRILEVGTGSGYHAAVMAWLARPGGHVWTLETVPELARRAARHLEKAGFPEVEVHHADGGYGLPDEAPFDRISVAAASPKVPPPLKEQLVDGGRMVVPVGRATCQLTTLQRTTEGFEEKEHGACVFVPLTGDHGKGGGAGGGVLGWGEDPAVS